MLFEQYDSDTFWHEIEVSFIPNQEWSILWLKQRQTAGDNYSSMIDNLSPIYCLNYNEVQSLTNDTTISVGNCVTLNALTFGAYDSAYWKTSDGTIASNALVGITVCPAASTDYVVCTRSTDCGNFWSYDTVHVEIPNSISSINPFQFSLTPTINCTTQPFQITTNQSCTIQIFDVNGKTVSQQNFNSGTNNFKLDGELQNGVYFYRVVSHQGVVAGKIVLVSKQ